MNVLMRSSRLCKQLVLFRTIPALLLILIQVTAGLTQAFEGVIVYEIPELENQIGTDELTYMLKKERVRLEYGEGDSQKTAIIFDTIEKHMYILFAMFDGYVEVPPDEFEEEEFQRAQLQFEETGRSKTIAGHFCEIRKTTFNGKSLEYCLSPGMGNFIIPSNSMTIDSIPEWAAVDLPDGDLPLEVVMVSSDHDARVLMRAKTIERKNLGKEFFNVNGP